MIVHKTVAGKGDGLEFVLSDATVDRYGDIVDPSGWVLSNFRKNPIALFGHSGGFPIGTWSNIRVEGEKLIARLNLAAKGTSARLDEIISLVEQGILRAVSVGFRPLKSEPIDAEKPWGAQRYTKQELLETSLVSVPANPAALAVAKSLNLSQETMALVFGDNVETRQRDMPLNGGNADTTRNEAPASTIKEKTMKTVSQRLEEATNKLAVRKQRHTDLINADELDTDAIEAVSVEIEKLQKEVDVLTASEEKMAKGGGSGAPAVLRRPLGFKQKEVKPLDLLVRSTLVNACAMFGNKGLDQVLAERYPEHDLTHAIVKATEAPLLTTGGSHAVSDLQQISYQGFIEALDGASVLPSLRSRGMNLSFDNSGTVFIPGVAADGAEGSFFAEGGAIRVGTMLTTGVQMTAKQMGIIIPFSRQSAQRSTPNLEEIIKGRIIAGASKTIDSHLLDNVAPDVGTARPGGLLYDQVGSATIAAAASGYGGGDHVAVIEDFKALLKPFIDANAADGITVILNPSQGFSIDAMTGKDGALGDWFGRVRSRFTFVESTHATKGRLIAIRSSDFASAFGGLRFEMSNTATVHMEQEAATVSANVGGSTTPVRSFFQTDSMGIRMVLDTNWRMVRQGMVAWIDGTSY